MKVLAIDTSNQILSVALLEDTKLIASHTTNVKNTHSITLMPAIENLLKQAKLTVADFDRFVVAKGPGSYTGLRIGVTTAKMLAASLNKELVGVSSLQLLAANLPKSTTALIVPLFDARRQNVFTGVYQYQAGELVAVLPEQHIALIELLAQLKELQQPVIFVGADSVAFSELIKESDLAYQIAQPQFNYPNAFVLGLLGLELSAADFDTFVPEYLRLTQAETQWLEKNPQENQRGNNNYVRKV